MLLTLNLLPNCENRGLFIICGVWALNGLLAHVRSDRREDDEHRKGKGEPNIPLTLQDP
jgi:hypothetical protein